MKTSQVIRALHSQFALVLSGTPLENRLDELYTVVQFVDDCQLGPAYRFFHKHRVVDDRRPLGWPAFDELQNRYAPFCCGRQRAMTMKQLPERTDEIVRIKPTAEQLEISEGQLHVAARIAAKKFLTEMDLLRLQKAVDGPAPSLTVRFCATRTESSSKLERLGEL
ncbi:MAG: SNF2-related protein [Pirellulaceae bacterium]